MSPSKRTNTIKRTSSLSKKDKEAWLTTWQDSAGVRHHALAKRERDDLYLVDVVTPCNGYVRDVLDTTGTDMSVTCVPCLTSRFFVECHQINHAAIDTLDTLEVLIDHFVDHDAMSIMYDPW